jgi:ribonucleotide monophosphatase NagD (HAD superfamily)
VEPTQVFCSHTPFRELAATYRKDRILIVGKKKGYSEYIAKEYFSLLSVSL